jgi:hypothetical protein
MEDASQHKDAHIAPHCPRPYGSFAQEDRELQYVYILPYRSGLGKWVKRHVAQFAKHDNELLRPKPVMSSFASLRTAKHFVADGEILRCAQDDIFGFGSNKASSAE